VSYHTITRIPYHTIPYDAGRTTQARLLSQDLLPYRPKNSKVLLFPYREICSHNNLSPRSPLYYSGDQLNLAISWVRDSKPPNLPFNSCDTRPSDMGITPSFISALTTCNRGLGLNVSASRNSHLREFVSRTLVPLVSILRDAIGQC
jgi:hypothetical protein